MSIFIISNSESFFSFGWLFFCSLTIRMEYIKPEKSHYSAMNNNANCFRRPTGCLRELTDYRRNTNFELNKSGVDGIISKLFPFLTHLCERLI